MLPEKTNEYVRNSLRQMLAYRNARIFFDKTNINRNTLQEFSDINRIDITDTCFGAIKSPDKTDFIKKIRSATQELLKELIGNLPDGPNKETRKDQLEYLKNLEQHISEINTDE